MKFNVMIVAVIFFLTACSSNTLKTGTANLKKPNDSVIIKTIKPYTEVITSKAVTDSGLFVVHKVSDRYFFEIPSFLLNQDVLIVSRIARGASNFRKGPYGYAGDQINETVIRFSTGPNNKLFIRKIWSAGRSLDTSENGMYKAVMNSSMQPIAVSFDIKTFSADSSIVVDVSDWLNNENNILYINPSFKGLVGLGAYQRDKSYIENIESFPLNVELHSVNTYLNGDDVTTLELNASIVLLPKAPMQSRTYDERVGYFWTNCIDFDTQEGVKPTFMVTKWRLEPKPEDREKYLKGELVEPVKPIIYYIDPATPKKWVPYLIQGVNDWQVAFEKAGFKNAIYALEAPKNDPSWSLYDARHSAVIYKASEICNASGPNVHDPRSGEILETHINWYHNVILILHDWYMVQAGPNDPRARKMVFDEQLMGRLIRYVISHEVGHTLGLAHNFGASSTTPTDSLRSKTFVSKNGICTSIMDYARFNYVAQPSDGLSPEELLPKVNVYDEWAINWGYRWLPDLKNKEQEKAFMDRWVTDNLRDSRLYYGVQQNFNSVSDPRCQPEDLGDDAMRSGRYGIENLKNVMPNLMEWAKEPNADFSALERIYQEVINQYSRYIFHVINNVGRKLWTPKTWSQKDSAFDFVSRVKQKEAIEFLQEQLFTTPKWLVNDDIFYRIGGLSTNLPAQLQSAALKFLLNGYGIHYYQYNLMTLSSKIVPPEKIYTFDELLTDLESGIFKELRSKMPVDYFRRRLQKLYVQYLVEMNDFRKANDPVAPLAERTDFFPIVQSHMRRVINAANSALTSVKDQNTKSHLEIIKMFLKESLAPNNTPRMREEDILLQGQKNGILNELPVSRGGFNNSYFTEEKLKDGLRCWENLNPLQVIRY